MGAQELIVAVDSGPGEIRVGVFDRDGALLAARHASLDSSSLWHGLLCYSIQELERVVIECVVGALDEVSGTVVALAIGTQRGSFALLAPDTGLPVTPLLDLHSYGQVLSTGVTSDEIARRHRSRAVCCPASVMAGSSLREVLAHVSGRVEFATLDVLVSRLLSGVHDVGTDPTVAASTCLMKIERLQWDPESIELVDSEDRLLLPSIMPSVGVRCSLAMSPIERLRSGVLVAVLGEPEACAVAMGAVREGHCSVTLMDSGFVNVGIGANLVELDALPTGFVTTVTWSEEDQAPWYSLEFSVPDSGSLLRRLAEIYNVAGGVPALLEAAAQSGESGGIILVPEVGSHEFTLVGLSSSSTVGQIGYAALEAIGFQLGAGIVAMAAVVAIDSPIYLTGRFGSLEFLAALVAAVSGHEVVVVPERDIGLRGLVAAARCALGEVELEDLYPEVSMEPLLRGVQATGGRGTGGILRRARAWSALSERLGRTL
ncbi:MAG: FGGY family carbohydrate kinase [Ferrimicrobium sp.]